MINWITNLNSYQVIVLVIGSFVFLNYLRKPTSNFIFEVFDLNHKKRKHPKIVELWRQNRNESIEIMEQIEVRKFKKQKSIK